MELTYQTEMVFSTMFFASLLSLVGAQQVCFNVEESEVNKVIFIGERDVVLTCETSLLSSANVTIAHEGKIVASSNGTGNYLKYSIAEVLMEDRGNYTCTIHLNEMGTETTIVETIHLSIQNTRPQCFPNGTYGVSYVQGDVLVMTCYCPPRKTCQWIRTVVGSRIASVILPYEKITFKSKTVTRIWVEGNILTKDNGTRFDCFTDVAASDRCSISITDSYSSEDKVSDLKGVRFSDSAIGVNSTKSCKGTDLIESTDSSYVLTVTLIEETETSAQPMLTTLDENEVKPENAPKAGKTTLIIISVTVLYILISVISIFLICIGRHRYGKNRNSIKSGPEELNYNSQAVINGAFITNEDNEDVVFQSGDVSHYNIPFADIQTNITTEKGSQDYIDGKSQQYEDTNDDISAMKEDKDEERVTGGKIFDDIEDDRRRGNMTRSIDFLSSSKNNDVNEPYAGVDADNENYQEVRFKPRNKQSVSVDGSDFSVLYAEVKHDKEKANREDSCVNPSEMRGDKYPKDDLSEPYIEDAKDSESYGGIVTIGLTRNRQAASVARTDFSELYAEVRKNKKREDSRSKSCIHQSEKRGKEPGIDDVSELYAAINKTRTKSKQVE